MHLIKKKASKEKGLFVLNLKSIAIPQFLDGNIVKRVECIKAEVYNNLCKLRHIRRIK